MAQDVADLPGQDTQARATGVSVDTSPEPGTVTEAQDAVEDVTTLKGRISELDTKLKHAEGKRIPDLMSLKDKAEADLKKAEARVKEIPIEMLGWIREGARRNLTASQLLQLIERDQQAKTAKQSPGSGGREQSQELIIREMRSGDRGFAEFLADLAEDVPVTEGNIERLRERYTKMTPAASSGATPAQHGGAVTAPRVPSGQGGPGARKGPAWRPGMRPGALIEAGFKGTNPGDRTG